MAVRVNPQVKFLESASQEPVADGPRISVIIPSYNSGPFLRDALTSLLRQVPRPHEIVVQDGGSTDDTLDILRSCDESIRWNSVPDEGQADALNRALSRATGDIVIWVNADDVLVPGAFAAASAAFAADRDLVFAYGDFDVIDADGAVIRTYRSRPYSWTRVYARGCYIFSGSLFVRRSALVGLGGFDSTLRACMDLDLLLRLGAAGPSTYLGRTIGQLRMHGSNKSSTLLRVFLREGFRVRRRYAHGSPRLWLSNLWATVVSSVMLATTGLRFSSRWPRHGRGKTL
jgi:glycosyltransferase involved in cell wall biosynthesis